MSSMSKIFTALCLLALVAAGGCVSNSKAQRQRVSPSAPPPAPPPGLLEPGCVT